MHGMVGSRGRRFVRWMAAGFATAGWLATGQFLKAQAPEITGVRNVGDEYGSGGIMELDVDTQPNSMLRLERAADLEKGPWTSDAVGVLSPGGAITLSTPIGEGVPQEFLRVGVEPYTVRAQDTGDEIEVGVGTESPLVAVLAALQRDTGLSPYLTDPNDLYRTIRPGSYRGSEIFDLGWQWGVTFWGPVFSGGDEDRMPGLEGADRRKDGGPYPVPGDDGIGEIDDGWPGNEGMPIPIAGEPPGPGTFDKPFDPEIPGGKDAPQRESGLPPPGRHLRLVVETDPDQARLMHVVQADGDARLRSDYRAPDIDALVWVVHSLLLPGEGIYHIGAFPNPWRQDTFDIPFRGAHDVCCMGNAIVRIPVPLLEKSTIDDVTVRLYRYTRPAAIEYLDETSFLRHQRSFTQILEISGRELQGMIGARATTFAPTPSHSTKDATITRLHNSGSKASKFNIVIMGDGFRDTVADQDAYNNYVRDTIMNGLLPQDIHPEILNAINFYRINTFSVDSGVTTVDTNGTVVVSRNTSLDFRYSRDWNRCWMELGPNSNARMQNLIDTLCPEADFSIVVLNVSTGGGCRRGSHFAVTLASQWTTVAHEFGHLFGFLGDEYQCNQGSANCGSYTGDEPGAANLTADTTRNTLKWKQWVPATRPIPTTQANVADETQDVGVFPGAMTSMTKYWTGIYRPSWRGRMNNNAPPHNPIGYTAIRDNARTRQDGDFRKSAVGDFNGDGRTDLVLIDGHQLSLYLAANRDPGPDDPVTGSSLRPVTGVLEPVWYHTDLLRNPGVASWEFRGSDILLPGDFDGDGKDDLYVVNLDAWAIPYVCMLKSTGTGFLPVRRYDLKLPGWDDMRIHDEFYVGDFNGDGRDDLMVFNGRDWAVPYFILLRSTGNALAYTRRYDRFLPGWEMGRHEKFHVGRFGDGANAGVIAHNTRDWAKVHFHLYGSGGSSLNLKTRWYGEIPGFWTMRRRDVLHTLDFNGDRNTDLVIFNGFDWAYTYLGTMAWGRGSLFPRRRYDNGNVERDVVAWWLERRDRFWVADVNGDGFEDLVAYNTHNWDSEYLGILRSDGEGMLTGTWQKGAIGAWNLGAVDSFHVADFRGTAGWEDLFVYNHDWLGLLRSYRTSFHLEAIYPKWIHNHRYNSYGWW